MWLQKSDYSISACASNQHLSNVSHVKSQTTNGYIELSQLLKLKIDTFDCVNIFHSTHLWLVWSKYKLVPKVWSVKGKKKVHCVVLWTLIRIDIGRGERLSWFFLSLLHSSLLNIFLFWVFCRMLSSLWWHSALPPPPLGPWEWKIKGCRKKKLILSSCWEFLVLKIGEFESQYIRNYTNWHFWSSNSLVEQLYLN